LSVLQADVICYMDRSHNFNILFYAAAFIDCGIAIDSSSMSRCISSKETVFSMLYDVI